MIGSIHFQARHRHDLDLDTLAAGYERALLAIAAVPVTWKLADSSDGSRHGGSGGYRALHAYMAGHQDVFDHLLNYDCTDHRYLTIDGIGMVYRKSESDLQHWFIDSCDATFRPVTAAFLHQQVALCRAALAVPGLEHATVSRGQAHQIHFPLRPPLAGANFAVVTTVDAVDAAYTDPAVFWRAWDTVEPHGHLRLCTRALDLPDPADDVAWLGRTFEASMALARAARPGLTQYDVPRPRPELAPFWTPGPRPDAAGQPVLALVGYDPADHLVEYAGFVPDPEPGFPMPHLLVRDILTLRALQRRKALPDGRPVASVRVVFPSEAMARPERRPIRDCGARLFFLGPAGDLVEITD
ncbi:MAG: hypothetical protein R3B06_14680 [Kofleriaceae bacterium]